MNYSNSNSYSSAISYSGNPLTSITIADIFAYEVEPGVSFKSMLRLMSAVLLGKTSNAGTSTETFRDINDTIDRVISTNDSNGNRISVIKDVS